METYINTTAQEVPIPAPVKKVKPVTSRLRKSTNFWKLDRMLDDYIDRTDLLKSGPKLLLKKLLNLRTGEDDNHVKTTVSGLAILLAVNKKTIRAWLKMLEDAGFMFFQENVWDPHCNYPKKKFVFPVTFPGFDAATVFVRKGAKAKFKERNPDPVKVKAKLKKAVRIAAQSTCPVVAPLLDCPTHFVRRTRNIVEREDTNVSSPIFSPMISNISTGSRSARPARSTTLKPKVAERVSKPKPILELAPDLRALLVTVLVQNKCKGKIQFVSNFIEQRVMENRTFRTLDDRQELADDLTNVIPYAFNAFNRDFIKSLFKFLRTYIENFTAHSYSRTREYSEQAVNRLYRGDQRQGLFQQYPFCNPQDGVRRTGVNR